MKSFSVVSGKKQKEKEKEKKSVSENEYYVLLFITLPNTKQGYDQTKLW